MRELISDTGPTSYTIEDDRLQRWIDDARSQETLRIYLPTGTDSATGATVQVSVINKVLTLTLQRTIGGESADTFALAPAAAGVSATKIRNAIDWIGGLAKGWRVGVAIGDDLDWCVPSSTTWLRSLVVTSRLPLYAPAINLAVTGAAAAAYGAEADAAELQFNQIYQAARLALAFADVDAVTSRRSGNVRRTFRTSAEALGALVARGAAEGIYAV